MTTKRKADLQRRLSMASMPKPPAGLADRIKADIPDLLGTTRERERLSSSIAFNLRVAASIILLISSAYLCVQLLSRAGQNEARMPVAAAAKPRVAPAILPAPAPPVPVPQQAMVSESVADAVRRPATPALERVAPTANIAERDDRETSRDNGVPGSVQGEVAGGVVGGTVGGVVGGVLSEPARSEEAKREAMTITASAPAILQRAAQTPAPENAPVPMPPPPAAEATAKTASGVEGGVEGSAMVPSARAADLRLAARDEVFGISIDRNAFTRVKDAIERGERPRNVNVEALINYFAGPPERRAPREVGLEVEASPAPVSAGPRMFIIRMTIDTAHAAIPQGGSVPPVATNARIELDLDSTAVLSHHRAGSGDALSGAEPTLLENVSVTGLYEVELRPNLPWHQPIATVRLHYRSVASGHEKTITRVVHASDVARAWVDASRRHRLASLGAVWGETLKNAPGATDVARRAEELANQEPKDVKARELAMLASASSRLQSSAPTGSGR
jgi:hypothetical protein